MHVCVLVRYSYISDSQQFNKEIRTAYIVLSLVKVDIPLLQSIFWNAVSA